MVIHLFSPVRSCSITRWLLSLACLVTSFVVRTACTFDGCRRKHIRTSPSLMFSPLTCPPPGCHQSNFKKKLAKLYHFRVAVRNDISKLFHIQLVAPGAVSAGKTSRETCTLVLNLGRLSACTTGCINVTYW